MPIPHIQQKTVETAKHSKKKKNSQIRSPYSSIRSFIFESVMKRDREMAAIDTANCLMLLSKVGETDQGKRVFACKTCNKEFPSFQALGGHRASHKKPKLMTMASSGEDFDQAQMPPASPKKPKTHECSICGLEFAIGQALGGHMRRHRAAAAMGAAADGLVTRPLLPLPVLKKSNSCKRVLCLDLNLMPTGDDLKLWVA